MTSLYKEYTEYTGDNMDEVQHPMDVNEREMVWCFHDESTFYANDGTRLIWQDDQTVLIPKTNGSSLMYQHLCARVTG